MLKIIEDQTGLKLDQVCGNRSWKFFHEDYLPVILSCVPDKYHDVVGSLHKSVVLQAGSSSDCVNINLFERIADRSEVLEVHTRRYLETLSQETSTVDQLGDVHNRLLERRDPYIVEIKLLCSMFSSILYDNVIVCNLFLI